MWKIFTWFLPRDTFFWKDVTCLKAVAIFVNESGSEIQDILFDFDVDETREEETGTQTKESEYLFVPEPEKPFDENWFINDDNKWIFTLVYLHSTFRWVSLDTLKIGSK